METLETSVDEVEVSEVGEMQTSYEGLQLVSLTNYQGPTSIKYWM